MSTRPAPHPVRVGEPAPSVAAEAETARAGELGQELVADRYLLLGPLGEGGMGRVHRARDLELDEIVALKMLRPDLLGSPDAVERFRREVKLARRVTHRSVARTFDIGEHQGARFLTMELVRGESLARRLTRWPAPTLAEAIDVATAICEGLEAAHEAGVVHRDLKPENVMLADDGRVVIMDFGIARALSADAALRATGSPIGTPAYMAPEQLEGRDDVDGRADVYALGIMLFELCTGRAPFSAESSYALAAARLSKSAPDPVSVRPDLPPALASCVRRALERERAFRFPTARAFADALRDARTEAALAEGRTSATLLSAAQPSGTVASPVPSSSGVSGAMSATPSGARTIAVLPLIASSDDDGYLADGLTEDLVDQLSMTPGLRVRPRSAVAKLRDARGPERDLEQVGRALAVQFVVDGSVRRRGDVVRLSVRLVATHDGFQTWARRFERPASELLSVVDELAAAIAEALTVPVGAASRRAPTTPAALDLYFRARHEYGRLDAVSVLRAVELYEEALALAPDDPTILTGNALARVRQWFFGGVGSGELAERAAERAIAGAPGRGEPYVALAAVRHQQGRAVDAVRSLRDALARAPALAEAHELLGRILSETGPLDLALGHLSSAAKLDPALHHASWTIARLHALRGRWAEAEALVDRTAREAAVPGGWLYVARLAVFRGDAPRAARVLDEPALARPENDVAARLLRSVTEGPRTLDVDRLFDPTVGTKHSSGRSAAFLHQIRCELFARAGRSDDAEVELARAVSSGLLDVVWIERCPLLDPLRGSARFEEARAGVEARAAAVRAALE